MDIYKGFAAMYDELMNDIPYQKWGDYIFERIKQRCPNTKKPLVLDLACGTGNMTIFLSKKGFDMIGVDLSIDMLAAAQQKAYGAKQKILFLAQDMRELDLYGTIDAAVSVCDGLNYILKPDELRTVFERVRLFLNPGGVFIFDMNTEYKFKELLAQRSFEAETGNIICEWDNSYDEITKINEYRVCFFTNQLVKESDQLNCEKFMEVHKQRAYYTGDVVQMLKNCGFGNVDVYHEYTDEPPRPDSARVTFVAE